MKNLPKRYILMPLLGGLVSILGGTQTTVFLSAVLTLAAIAVFTVAESLLLEKVFGKIGASITTWWFSHVLFKTIALIAVLTLFFGAQTSWIALAALCLSWIGLCGSDFKTWTTLVAMRRV